MALFDLAKLRLENSIITIPVSLDCILAIILLFIFGLIIIPIGFYVEFLKFEIIQVPLNKLFSLIFTTLFFPAAAEEIFFRVLLIPHPSENVTIFNQSFYLMISLIIFIVYHPLNSMFFVRNARKIFNSFIFLFSATILGFICSVIYLKSSSIYPSIVIHWIVVLVWLTVFGGYQKLNEKADSL